MHFLNQLFLTLSCWQIKITNDYDQRELWKVVYVVARNIGRGHSQSTCWWSLLANDGYFYLSNQRCRVATTSSTRHPSRKLWRRLSKMRWQDRHRRRRLGPRRAGAFSIWASTSVLTVSGQGKVLAGLAAAICLFQFSTVIFPVLCSFS